MTDLRARISGLASDFASQVLAALRAASLDDINDLSRERAPQQVQAKTMRRSSRAGRTKRRGDGVEDFLGVLGQHPEGLRSEHLRRALGVTRDVFARHVARAIAKGAIRREGERRSTRYYVC
jgi:hypothetical protein